MRAHAPADGGADRDLDDLPPLARAGLSSIPLRTGLPPPSPEGSADGTALSPMAGGR